MTRASGAAPHSHLPTTKRPSSPSPLVKIADTLPPVFITSMFAIAWVVYTHLHLLPLLQMGEASAMIRGLLEFFVSQGLTSLLIICFTQVLCTEPGFVPRCPPWVADRPEDLVHWDASAVHLNERKTTGSRRHCKWCNLFKPDRTHHCRVCNVCVLKMDHHCPWIKTCIGFRNQKYFFLLVLYAMLTTGFFAATMSESVLRSTVVETTVFSRFLLVLGMSISAIFFCFTAVFLLFHTVIMCRGMTTIEFCERSIHRKSHRSTYNRGMLLNIMAVLGPKPRLWFLPISLPEGDGVHFGVEGDPAGAPFDDNRSCLGLFLS